MKTSPCAYLQQFPATITVGHLLALQEWFEEPLAVLDEIQHTAKALKLQNLTELELEYQIEKAALEAANILGLTPTEFDRFEEILKADTRLYH